MNKFKLSEEEQQILEDFGNRVFVSHDKATFETNKTIAMNAARNFMKKSERINIRLTKHDLAGIKRIAAREGMPYQTLISSILHKYAAGYLKI